MLTYLVSDRTPYELPVLQRDTVLEIARATGHSLGDVLDRVRTGHPLMVGRTACTVRALKIDESEADE